MDHHRDLARDPPDYLRSSKRGIAMGAPPRAIPPSSVPSLSSGQGFYTVESLEGATVVPPPQLAPPPPRFLPAEPYPRFRRLYDERECQPSPDDRAFGMPPPFLSNRHPLRQRPLPHPGFARRGGVPGMVRPPPFTGDPRMQQFYPGRERAERRGRGWGPMPRHWSGRRLDAGFGRYQRERGKKQSQKKGTPEAKSSFEDATTADQSLGEGGSGWCSVCQINCSNAKALKKHVAGATHKRQQESNMHVVGGMNDGEDKEKLDQNDEIMKEFEEAEDSSGQKDEIMHECENVRVSSQKDDTTNECKNLGAGSDEVVYEGGIPVVKMDADCINGKTVQGPHEFEVAASEGDEAYAKKIAEAACNIVESGEEVISIGGENGKETVDDKASDTASEITRKVVDLDHDETPKEDQSNADAIKCVSPVVSGKRGGAKEEVPAFKKQCNSDTQNLTTKGVSEVCKLEKTSGSCELCSICGVSFSTKLALETHLKGKKHAAFPKKTVSSSSVEVQSEEVEKEAAATGAKPTLEAVNELIETVDLVHGKTGQSVEVQ